MLLQCLVCTGDTLCQDHTIPYLPSTAQCGAPGSSLRSIVPDWRRELDSGALTPETVCKLPRCIRMGLYLDEVELRLNLGQLSKALLSTLGGSASDIQQHELASFHSCTKHKLDTVPIIQD